MRSCRHWTPRYVKNRLAEIYYHKTCPDHPWLTRASNQILASCLRKSDIGLEFGSGRSTLWFAKRIEHLTSVEHHELWYRKVRQMLEDHEQSNVDYRLIPMDKEDRDAGDAAYVKILDHIRTDSIDVVLVDGIYRDFCALKALRVIRPGGILVLDNANWFLPCDSYSPHSRTLQQGPQGSIWEEFLRSVLHWRKIWTSSGVTDTAFFFKPCDRLRPVQGNRL